MTTDPSPFLTALRLSDSFLPVGDTRPPTVSSSTANEDRVETGDDLRELLAAYLRRVVGPCETVALANAHAACTESDLERLLVVDERLYAVTLPREFRESSTKAGAKLSELFGPNGAAGSNAGTGTGMGTGPEPRPTRPKRRPTVAISQRPSPTRSIPVRRRATTRSSSGSSPRLAAFHDSRPVSHTPTFVVSGCSRAAQRLGRFGHTEIQSVLEAL